MRFLMFCTCVWLAQSAIADDSFKPLFDGKTFTGWEGNQSVFRIEDGAVRRWQPQGERGTQRIPLYDKTLPGLRGEAEIQAARVRM